MTEQERESSVQVRFIAIEEIGPSPYQPRTHFDEAKLEELAASIKEKGVLQPITVRKVEGTKPYELVMGERRLRASKTAGLDKVPCILKELSDDQAREMAIVENLQRDDLTPIEEARSVQALVEAHGDNKAAAARTLGKQDAYVHQILELLTLPPDVQNMLDARTINVAHARVLLEVEGAEKQLKGAQLVQKLNLSSNQLRARLQKDIPSKKKNAASANKEGSQKGVSFKTLSTSLVHAYEALEGFEFNELEGDEKGLKNREMLRKQLSLVRQSMTRAENILLRDPPKQKQEKKGTVFAAKNA